MDKTAVFVYCQNTGTTLDYLQSMMQQLLRGQYPNKQALSYGMILPGYSLRPRDRIHINGQPVDSDVFDRCSLQCKERLDTYGISISSPSWPVNERLDAVVVSIALYVFKYYNVSTICVALPLTQEIPVSNAPSLLTEAAQLPDSPETTTWYAERLVVDNFQPKTIVCGVEPLPAYTSSLSEEWRRSLIYLMQQQNTRIISSTQPRPVRMQLYSLAKIFDLSVDMAQSLSAYPACKGLQLGIYGPEQHHFAKLALAISQFWAAHNGLVNSSYYSSSPLSNSQNSTQGIPRSVPLWMVRGIADAHSNGLFHTIYADFSTSSNWHYSWAETPGDFGRAGMWFNTVCQKTPPSQKILLIHLPESFLSTVRYQDEEDGTWRGCDYRELLRQLYIPIRGIELTGCVFAADILNETNVIDSNVPPTLPQYALRDYWSQITGMNTEQISIAPSLASALKTIATSCNMLSIGDTLEAVPESPVVMSPLVQHGKSYFEPSCATGSLSPISQFNNSVDSQTTITSNSTLKNATSVDNLRELRRKVSHGVINVGSVSTISLPSRVHQRQGLPQSLLTPPSSGAKLDILVTGSRSFVHSTLSVAHR